MGFTQELTRVKQNLVLKNLEKKNWSTKRYKKPKELSNQ